MPRKPLLSRCVVALLAITVGATSAAAAEPNDAALSKITELNRRALLAYDSLEMETASTLLHQALNVCRTHGLDDSPAAARTHLHLGIVYISGLKFLELGMAELRDALAIDPTIQIEQSLANPEVQAAFEEARSPDGAKPPAHEPLPFPTGQESGPAPSSGDRLGHPRVTEAPQAQPIPLKVHVPPGMGASRVILAYMAQDANEFLAREMVPVGRAAGWFQQSIPPAAARGAWVAYYLEARDADDHVVSRHGGPDDPHQIVLIPEDAPDEPAPEEATASEQAKPAPRRSGLWLIVALGSGAGYHSGTPEMNPRDATGAPIDVAGFGGAQLLHLAPEIGYFQRPNLVLSAQGRFQYVTGTQTVAVGQRIYHPAALAMAGLAKATWIVGPGAKRLQPLLSVMLGAGQLRHAVTTPPGARLTGCGLSRVCRDTVLGGLLLFGAGAGLRYRLNESFGFYAAASLLVGLPHEMINGDFNVGVSIVR